MQFLSIFANKVDDGYGGFMYEFTTLGYVAIIVAILALLLIISLLGNKEKKQLLNTKQLVFAAVAIALAMVTSNLKLFRAPMGGSVTLCSMLFICLIGYWYGLKIGFTTALAYGFLQLMIDPFVISLPQLLIDYIFAFGALGLAGVFTNSKHGLIKGYLLGVFGRYVFSIISGVVFFASYAEEYSMSPFLYSATYNGSYIGAELIITIIILLIPPVTHGLHEVKKLANQ